jgi:hypothetical protein
MTGASTLRALLGNDAREVEKVRSCPTTLFASLGLDIEHDPTLRLTLVDGAWIAGLTEAERLTKSGGNVEAVKSLLDGAH